MAHKLPSLGFLETAGFRELIQNTKGGILIKEKPSAESLANGLLLLINDAENRLKIGSQAHQGISQYRPSDIVLRWRELLSR